MHISDFDYELPAEIIAQHPLPERDVSRMLIVDRESKTWIDSTFKEFPTHLREGDVLVLNNTRVFPARLRGRRSSGGAVELLLLREVQPRTWEALARPARRVRNGDEIVFGDGKSKARVRDSLPDGVRVVEFESSEGLAEILEEIGEIPLPPYIKRDGEHLTEGEDKLRYQTIYAREQGAIAAPTAGLHFTPSIIEMIKQRGVTVTEITLHVGYGTFEPVRVSDIADHQVRPESYSISDAVAATINEARSRGQRIIAVGTTTTRALESASGTNGLVAGTTLANLTIVPGYRFRVVDALLTNFHLPQSSLLLLVCAFAGREFALDVYRHAVKERYRFYSYGDCMFIT